jgi:two-component system LytT family response regulator
VLKPFDDLRFEAAWARLAQMHAARSLADEARRFSALLTAVAGSSATVTMSESSRNAPGATGRFAERLVVRNGDRSYPVPVQDIRWVQSDGNYVDLFTANGRHTLRETLQELERRLDPARFVRIHRRVIVAIDQIKELQPWFAGDQVLILNDGTKLRVSRTRREAVVARLEGRG